jgi:hypothetical protein
MDKLGFNNAGKGTLAQIHCEEYYAVCLNKISYPTKIYLKMCLVQITDYFSDQGLEICTLNSQSIKKNSIYLNYGVAEKIILKVVLNDVCIQTIWQLSAYE